MKDIVVMFVLAVIAVIVAFAIIEAVSLLVGNLKEKHPMQEFSICLYENNPQECVDKFNE